jgi:hypothetical protein
LIIARAAPYRLMNKACRFFISGKFNMDMDCSKLAELVTTLLMKIPEGAFGKIGENITDALPKLREKVLSRLRAKPLALEAANDAAAAPNDADAQAAFRFQVKKLLEEDPDFAKEIAEIVKTGQTTIQSPTVATSGEKSPGFGVVHGPVTIHYGDEKND